MVRRRYPTFLYGTRNTSEGGGEREQTNKRTIWLGSTQSARRASCDTLLSLCICRLTLTYILREISTKPRRMLTHLDWSSLIAPWPYLMPTGLFCCPGSTPDFPSASPFANSSLWVPLSNSLSRSFTHFRSRWRSQAQAFVWFRAKTNKKIVCLAHPLHSVTSIPKFYKFVNIWLQSQLDIFSPFSCNHLKKIIIFYLPVIIIICLLSYMVSNILTLIICEFIRLG